MSLEELKYRLTKEKEEIEAQLKEIDELRGEIKYEIETAAQLGERVKNKPHKPKIMTGVGFLDNNLGGFEFGTFINIAGEAGAGKTTLLLKILTNISEGHKVLFFSYEMYEDRLIRFIRKLTSNYLSYQNLYVEQEHRNINDIENIIKAKAKEGIKLFVIDSIMKIEAKGDGVNEKRSYISATLAKLTQHLGVVIILINQVSKGDLKDGRVDFKGSGDVAYDSDINLFINLKRGKSGAVEGRRISCSKNRDGNFFEAMIPDFFAIQNEYDFSGVPR
ncbi:MAG: AAA family ATPase [Campylobacteraceae bacterium]|jgi:predicted ATP-dependent serine protease|nr:AAA family ATPase [Campylobacteraceae bacterium]